MQEHESRANEERQTKCSPGVGAREYNAVLTVPNGVGFGTWGPRHFCHRGYAKGFSLMVQRYQGPFVDDTSLNGIRLHCTDGMTLTSHSPNMFGFWSGEKECKTGFLNSFSPLGTPDKGLLDDTGAENIMFTCTDGTELEGSGHGCGWFGPWSDYCPSGGICGIQTRVQVEHWFGLVDTGLNNVKFFCCSLLGRGLQDAVAAGGGGRARAVAAGPSCWGSEEATCPGAGEAGNGGGQAAAGDLEGGWIGRHFASPN
ncbi:vitelline membrane outer layer protein 1-like [Paroedura picta]|uniref:vitelline membrane outer layer protein 1-like n=1 Tax=Paroedura picta TaxID=143630 RepID=UPI004055FB88